MRLILMEPAWWQMRRARPLDALAFAADSQSIIKSRDGSVKGFEWREGKDHAVFCATRPDAMEIERLLDGADEFACLIRSLST
ncbi:hypothetical protein F2P79_001764 [Pimephales promelas]|nr:hypothetical protein F2P79_001764 [Pimephales promelas]